MRNEKLLPCPLCGHVAFNGGGVMGASCSNKHCALYDTSIPFDQWNTRVSAAMNEDAINFILRRLLCLKTLYTLLEL